MLSECPILQNIIHLEMAIGRHPRNRGRRKIHAVNYGWSTVNRASKPTHHQSILSGYLSATSLYANCQTEADVLIDAYLHCPCARTCAYI